MAKQTKTKAPEKKFESLLGKSGRIKTSIYSTSPKVSIEVEGRLSAEDSKELPFVIDAFLKEKGY